MLKHFFTKVVKLVLPLKYIPNHSRDVKPGLPTLLMPSHVYIIYLLVISYIMVNNNIKYWEPTHLRLLLHYPMMTAYIPVF